MIFDLYCLGMAAPGSVHYGYYIISFEFVYVGSAPGKSFYFFFKKNNILNRSDIYKYQYIINVNRRYAFGCYLQAWEYISVFWTDKHGRILTFCSHICTILVRIIHGGICQQKYSVIIYHK